jgi:hypothetical protein
MWGWTLLYALIDPSAWNRSSRKFTLKDIEKSRVLPHPPRERPSSCSLWAIVARRGHRKNRAYPPFARRWVAWDNGAFAPRVPRRTRMVRFTGENERGTQA